MSRLSLHLFGRFSATLDQQPIKITSPKSQALLSWLALQTSHSHNRETVAALLWPEHDTSRAQQNLRKTLSRLRKLIPDHLATSRSSVERIGDWHSDAAAFVQAVNAQSWEAAAAAYGSDLLLELGADSAEFDAWLLLERETLQRHYLQALAQLTAAAFDRDAYEDALGFASQTIAADPFDEMAYCDMMEAYALLNRPREAVALYERLETLLSAELNLIPSAETTAILQQITDGSYSTRRTRLAASDEPPPHNLPRQHSRFIGRVALKERAVNRLGAPDCHLLTLVGIGGAGKTRLSLAIGSELLTQFADGVWFVPLEDASGEAEMVERVAAAVGISLSPRLAEPAARLAAVVDQLRGRSLLLLLDNYESVIDHVTFVQTLIADAPKVKLLVTSRSTLRLQSEWVIDVDGLAVPPADADLGADDFEAVQLFNEVAKRISAETNLSNPNAQQAIAQITRDVGGIPLAIELAAAWCRSFSAEQVASRIASGLDILATQMRDASPRHRSMRAVLEQTWLLLTAAEQSLFSQLAVFEGGFDLAAAKSILGTTAEQLNTLIASFLLRQQDGRYTLHPLVSQFAQEKWQTLAETDRKPVQQRHSDHFVAWVASLNSLYDPSMRRQVQPDMDNARSAWRQASSTLNLSQMAAAQHNLFAYHDFAGSYETVYTLFEASEQLLREQVPQTNTIALRRAYLLLDMAMIRFRYSRMEESLALAEEAKALAEHSEDAAAMVRAYARIMGCLNSLGQRDAIDEMGQLALSIVEDDDDLGKAEIYSQLATTALMSGDGEKGEEYGTLDVALRRGLDNPPRLAVSLLYLGFAYGRVGRMQDEVDTVTEAYELLRDSEVLYETCTAGNNLAAALSELGEVHRAVTLYQEVLETARKLNEKRMISVILSNLGDLMRRSGRFDSAETYLKEGLVLGGETDDKLSQLYNREGLGWMYACVGEFEAGLEHIELALDGYREGGWTGRSLRLHVKLGDLALWQGDTSKAQQQSKAARQLYAETKDPIHALTIDFLDGSIALELEAWDAALERFRAAQALFAEAGNEFVALNVLAGQALALHRLGDLAGAMKLIEQLLAQRSQMKSTDDEANMFPYFVCVEVLRASGDERSEAILEEGLSKLMEISAEISSPKRRSSFLNNIPYNKRLADLIPTRR